MSTSIFNELISTCKDGVDSIINDIDLASTEGTFTQKTDSKYPVVIAWTDNVLPLQWNTETGETSIGQMTNPQQFTEERACELIDRGITNGHGVEPEIMPIAEYREKAMNWFQDGLDRYTQMKNAAKS